MYFFFVEVSQLKGAKTTERKKNSMLRIQERNPLDQRFYGANFLKIKNSIDFHLFAMIEIENKNERKKQKQKHKFTTNNSLTSWHKNNGA